MVVTGVFAGAFASVVLEEAWDKAKSKMLEKPATKVFEDAAQKITDNKMLENMDMENFLKLCDRTKYPESRRIIENVYQNLGITEEEKSQFFRDFKEIFSGNKRDLSIIFEEFLKIFQILFTFCYTCNN